MVIVVLVVFGVVVFLATGRGGELSRERNDFVPLDLGPVTATDIALLRPPSALWGYNMQATDDAMDQIAASIRERDVRIVALEQLVTDLSRDQAPALPLSSPYPGARHRRPGADPATGSLSGISGPADQADEAAWSGSVDDSDPAPELQETTVHPETAAAEPVRLDFDPGRPGSEQPGPPPERTHD
jgi:hypothetical protein